jgi:hypothetical protein
MSVHREGIAKVELCGVVVHRTKTDPSDVAPRLPLDHSPREGEAEVEGVS